MFNSYNGILVAFGLVAGAIIYVTTKLAWSDRWRKPVEPGLQESLNGDLHVIPGEGHVKDWDCICRPDVSQELGQPRFVEHRPLPVLQRGDCS